MRRGFVFGVAGVLLVGLICPAFVCGEEKPPKIKVVATLFPFADWAGQIGGEYVEVISLLKPGASPHTYELTTKDVKAIRDAKLLIVNGSGLDDWVGKLVERSANKGIVKLAMSGHLPLAPMPMMVTEESGKGKHQEDDDAKTGCGMWLDPMRAVRMVDLIAEALCQVDPEHKAYYQEQAKRYWGQLDRLDRMYRSKLGGLKGGVIAFHADLIYLFRRYGIEVYGVVEPYPGKEPSVDYIRKLTNLVSGKPLLFVLTEAQLSEKPAQVLANQLKVRAVMIDPIGGTGLPGRDSYISLMTYNLNKMVSRQ
ncbi:MAG: metal ABC transporter substrate-binding protein [Phycisphaerae bacterium]